MNLIWVSRVKTLLVGGSLLVSIGLGVTPAAAPPPVTEGPFAGVTQNWDKNLLSASRFTVLADFNNQAVRDNNTGLVWEQAPDGTAGTGAAAKLSCLRKVVGGTKGWRLPAVAELVSLQDPSLGAPFVPTVFSGIQEGYWSATADVTNPTLQGWVVGFNNSGDAGVSQYNNFAFVWCVRGPMNASTY